MRVLAALFAVVALLAAAGADDADAAAERRYLELARQLRCLVCQNQSLADSNAALARDMREVVKEMVARRHSDEEIIEFMTSRYGDFVRYRPPFKASTWLLWIGPFVVLLLAAVVVVCRRKSAPAPLSDEERARAAALLREDGG